MMQVEGINLTIFFPFLMVADLY